MALHQLSVFLENRPGRLRRPCEALAGAGVDILTASVADTAQFGILRLLVVDWERGRAALQAAGLVVNVSEVVALEVEHRPGALAEVLAAVDAAELAVEYMYVFAGGPRPGHAAIVLRFEDPARAAAALAQRGLRVLAEEELLGKKRP